MKTSKVYSMYALWIVLTINVLVFIAQLLFSNTINFSSLITSIVLTLFILVLYIIKKINRNKIATSLVHKANDPLVYVWNTREVPRLEKFMSIQENINTSLFIFGISMENVSKRTEHFKRLLTLGKNIRLLIYFPNHINSFNDCCKYLSREPNEYFRTIRDNIKSLYKFINTYEVMNLNGKIELKWYDTIIFSNITIINENLKESQLILEHCLPYSTERIAVCLNKNDKEMINRITDHYKNIWNKAHYVTEELISKISRQEELVNIVYK